MAAVTIDTCGEFIGVCGIIRVEGTMRKVTAGAIIGNLIGKRLKRLRLIFLVGKPVMLYGAMAIGAV